MRKFAIRIGLLATLFALTVALLTPDMSPSVPPGHEVACGGRVLGKARSGARGVVRFVGRVVTPFR